MSCFISPSPIRWKSSRRHWVCSGGLWHNLLWMKSASGTANGAEKIVHRVFSRAGEHLNHGFDVGIVVNPELRRRIIIHHEQIRDGRQTMAPGTAMVSRYFPSRVKRRKQLSAREVTITVALSAPCRVSMANRKARLTDGGSFDSILTHVSHTTPKSRKKERPVIPYRGDGFAQGCKVRTCD